jgi:hypothetical protein
MKSNYFFIFMAVCFLSISTQAQQSRENRSTFRKQADQRTERQKEIERLKQEQSYRKEFQEILSNRRLSERERLKKLADLRRKYAEMSDRRALDIFTRPTQGIYHFWNSGNWEYSYSTKYSHDSSANVNFTVHVDSVSKDTIYMSRYILNANGNVLSRTDYTKRSGVFIEFSKDSFQYHPEHPNFETLSLSYSDNGTSLILESGYKYEFTTQNNRIVTRTAQYYNGTNWELDETMRYVYDVNSRLIQLYEMRDANADTTYKREYKYSGTSFTPNRVLFFRYDADSSVFYEDEMYDSLLFQNFTKSMADYEVFDYDLLEEAKISRYVLSYWDEDFGWEFDEKLTANWTVNSVIETTQYWGAGWENSNRKTKFFTDSFTSVFSEEYDNSTTAWLPAYRDSTFFDRFYDLGVSYEIFDESDLTWKIDFRRKLEKEINSDNDLVSLTVKIWNELDGIMELFSKEVFTHWREFSMPFPANVEPLSMDEKFTIYPNPFSNQINIQNSLGSDVKVTIRDLSGRVLIQSNLNTSDSKIETSQLASGLYIATLETVSGQNAIFKIVKQ